VGAPTSPLRSRPESFRYYVIGGALYLVGALLLGAADQGTFEEALEVGLLVGGSVVVAVAFLVDRGTLRPPG
jgi:drug/metabolite transporter (DMT)-like permease